MLKTKYVPSPKVSENELRNKVIKNKVGLLNLTKELGNVFQACKVLGYNRDSFYRCKELYDAGGNMSLREISRKTNIKNRIE